MRYLFYKLYELHFKMYNSNTEQFKENFQNRFLSKHSSFLVLILLIQYVILLFVVNFILFKKSNALIDIWLILNLITYSKESIKKSKSIIFDELYNLFFSIGHILMLSSLYISFNIHKSTYKPELTLKQQLLRNRRLKIKKIDKKIKV